jgi:hypothetical protein
MWNSVLEDLGYDFERLYGFNPTIEVPHCWFDLSHSGLLYIACMGHQNYH